MWSFLKIIKQYEEYKNMIGHNKLQFYHHIYIYIYILFVCFTWLLFRLYFPQLNEKLIKMAWQVWIRKLHLLTPGLHNDLCHMMLENWFCGLTCDELPFKVYHFYFTWSNESFCVVCRSANLHKAWFKT